MIERKLVWPSNAWPKSKKQKMIGIWCLADTLNGLSAISMAIMTRVLGMSAKEVEATVEDVKKDMQDKSIHAFWPMYVFLESELATRPLMSYLVMLCMVESLFEISTLGQKYHCIS